MSHPTSELKIGEPDNPNTTAIYIIIFLCLAGLGVTFWGLSEYQGYIKEKRQRDIDTLKFERLENLNKAEKPLTEVIDKAIEAK